MGQARTAGGVLILCLFLLLGGCGGTGGSDGDPGDGDLPDLRFADETWLWSGRGAGVDYVRAIDAFPDNSVAVVGQIGDEVLLEAIDTDVVLDPSLGSLLVARMHPDGTLAWVRTDGGRNGVFGRGVVANADGSCLVAGVFRGSVTFGAGEANETTFASRGGEDIFLARYGPGGELDWVQQAGGSTPGGGYERLVSDTVSDMAGYADGSCVVVGHFSVSTAFGSGAGRVDVPGSTANSTYVARFAPDGAVLWASGINYTGSAYARVAARPDGSCALTGLIPAPTVPGSGNGRTRIGSYTLERAADGWSFLAAYAANGAVLWARGCGVGADVVPQDLSALGDGSLVVSGEMEGDPALVTGTGAVLTPPLAGRHSFLGRFDGAGSAVWTRKDDCVTTMRIEGDESGFVVAGVIQSIATLGAGSPTATVIDRGGDWGSFLARFYASGALSWARADGGTGLNLLTIPGGLALLPDGRIALAANFQGQAVIGEGGTNPAMLGSSGAWDFLVATYDARGGFSLP